MTHKNNNHEIKIEIKIKDADKIKVLKIGQSTGGGPWAGPKRWSMDYPDSKSCQVPVGHCFL